jgi:predicted transcriptional regulator of viral defense system
MTQTYQEGASRPPYGETAGVRLITALEGVGSDPFTTSQAAREGATLGLTRSHTIRLLHLLAVGSWITRIKKGIYAISDPVTKAPRAHPFAIGAALVTPSAISHWSALQHWGLTEQIPATVMLSSPKRTFPPTAESSGGGARPAWVVGGVRYEVIAVSQARFFGITQVWVNERNQVPIFDRERALLDAFLHFHIFGSISTALEILEAHLADIEVDRLVRYAVQLKVAAVVKRVGWALERLKVASSALESLRAYPAKEESPLDPGRPARGHHNSTWHVIENLNDGQ